MDLNELMAEMAMHNQKKEDLFNAAHAKFIGAGFSEREWEKLNLFKETFDDQAGAVAYHLCAATVYADKEAATIGKHASLYLANMADWMVKSLRKADIDPGKIFGVRRDMAEFMRRMGTVHALFERVENGEDLTGFEVSELI